MRRLACVNLPAFPLQLALRRHPQWASYPVAVVDSDRPQGRILWVNEKARSGRVLPGMRYAAALSLAGELRATEVSAVEIREAALQVIERLRQFSPDVEGGGVEEVDGKKSGAVCSGVFWLNALGLGGLFDSPARWAGEIRQTLIREEHLESSVAVGFRKFTTMAIAMSRSGSTVLRDGEHELEVVRGVSLDRLSLAPVVRDTLARLGVFTVGEFSALPPDGIRRRFGDEAWKLYREACGEYSEPLTAREAEIPLCREIHFDVGEVVVERLEVVIERELSSLFELLSGQGKAAQEVRIGLRFESGCDTARVESIRPAAPTTELSVVMELVHLRLSAIQLPSGVIDIELELVAVTLVSAQLELFAETPTRDRSAAARALARLRAEFGEGVVVRPQLVARHLPEAGFTWEPFEEMVSASPTPCCGDVTMVRRIYTPPHVLAARPRHEPDGWMLRGLEEGPVVKVYGPYVVSGGWWKRTVHREYHFAQTQRGDVLWVYYDRCRRRWVVQGRVE